MPGACSPGAIGEQKAKLMLLSHCAGTAQMRRATSRSGRCRARCAGECGILIRSGLHRLASISKRRVEPAGSAGNHEPAGGSVASADGLQDQREQPGEMARARRRLPARGGATAQNPQPYEGQWDARLEAENRAEGDAQIVMRAVVEIDFVADVETQADRSEMAH